MTKKQFQARQLAISAIQHALENLKCYDGREGFRLPYDKAAHVLSALADNGLEVQFKRQLKACPFCKSGFSLSQHGVQCRACGGSGKVSQSRLQSLVSA